MLRSDVRVTVMSSLVTCKEDRAARFFRVAFEHGVFSRGVYALVKLAGNYLLGLEIEAFVETVIFVEGGAELRGVQRALPFGDDDCGDGVADHVGGRQTLRHQAVNSQDKSNAGDRNGAGGRERGGQDNKSRAGDARCSF